MNAEVQGNEVDALNLIQQRNQFYKNKYHQILGLIVLCVLMIAILTMIFLFLSKNTVRPYYFLANEVGSFMQEIPIDQPFPTDQVTAWTIEAVEAGLTFDYVNYRAQMQDAQKYFTDYSWEQFMKALVASNNMLALKERKWIFIAKVVDKPILQNAGIRGGHYLWRFQVPVLMTFLQPPLYDKNSAITNAWQFDVIVWRQPLLQSYQGLAVYSIIGSTPTKPTGTALMPAS